MTDKERTEIAIYGAGTFIGYVMLSDHPIGDFMKMNTADKALTVILVAGLVTFKLLLLQTLLGIRSRRTAEQRQSKIK